MNGTIVALGGGGFSMSEDGTSALDDHLLELTGRSTPKVCFVPTASGDGFDYSKRFETAFEGRGETSVLSLFGNWRTGYADPKLLLDQDLIYVGGGSTANLLAIWRLHGLPDLLQQAAAKGTILAGISAGMNCWFEASSTDSFGPLATLNDGLGFLPGSACPHYLGEPGRRELYRGWIGSGELPDGYAVDDHAALVFRDGELVEAISEQPDRPVYRVERGDSTDGVEHPVPVRLLPAS